MPELDLELEDLMRLEAIAEPREFALQRGLTFKPLGIIIPWLNEVRAGEPST